MPPRAGLGRPLGEESQGRAREEAGSACPTETAEGRAEGGSACPTSTWVGRSAAWECGRRRRAGARRRQGCRKPACPGRATRPDHQGPAAPEAGLPTGGADRLPAPQARRGEPRPALQGPARQAPVVPVAVRRVVGRAWRGWQAAGPVGAWEERRPGPAGVHGKPPRGARQAGARRPAAGPLHRASGWAGWSPTGGRVPRPAEQRGVVSMGEQCPPRRALPRRGARRPVGRPGAGRSAGRAPRALAPPARWVPRGRAQGGRRQAARRRERPPPRPQAPMRRPQAPGRRSGRAQARPRRARRHRRPSRRRRRSWRLGCGRGEPPAPARRPAGGGCRRCRPCAGPGRPARPRCSTSGCARRYPAPRRGREPPCWKVRAPVRARTHESSLATAASVLSGPNVP